VLRLGTTGGTSLHVEDTCELGASRLREAHTGVIEAALAREVTPRHAVTGRATSEGRRASGS
jgi:hypothetical protein